MIFYTNTVHTTSTLPFFFVPPSPPVGIDTRFFRFGNRKNTRSSLSAVTCRHVLLGNGTTPPVPLSGNTNTPSTWIPGEQTNKRAKREARVREAGRAMTR